ncbi:hypothetical protein SAMN06265348_103367 [Pedobacter westerhofensis]|uniref:Uncharacterized protein n=1 Tax=Pedobacter westerhofensis TaxID=425512 RepID=A0A521CA97_9SPHI|nr:hypothetical protein SAMN06265348_103367 [Pedobacter westerhofensis]
MRTFEITIQGKTYHITELNKKSGLYEVCCDGIFHTIGRSCKTNDWLYIRKSAFSTFLPLKELTPCLDLLINNTDFEKLIA